MKDFRITANNPRKWLLRKDIGFVYDPEIVGEGVCPECAAYIFLRMGYGDAAVDPDGRCESCNRFPAKLTAKFETTPRDAKLVELYIEDGAS